MTVSAAKYLQALQDINLSLTTGLQTAVDVLENFERLTEEQRSSLIKQMKELVKSSQNVYKT